MKEIKFRAISKEHNFNIAFTISDLVNPEALFSIRELVIPWLREGNIPDTYTGLKDKNSKEIYEGDIVRFKQLSGNCYTGEVMYDSEYGASRFVFFAKVCVNLASYNMDIYGTTEWEVIGNIYDNPELL